VTASWDLKLDRAEEHLGEFKSLIDPLLQRCVNPVTKKWETHNQKSKFVYRVSFTNPAPDERLAVVAGDVMHNIRSALDHAAVALVSPGKQHLASFPIFTTDPNAADEGTGKNLRPNDLRAWRKCVQDMPDQAVSFLDMLQPYHGLEDGDDPNDSALALLAEFQNADKHRQLSVIAQGLDDLAFFFIGSDGTRAREEPPEGSVPPNGLMRNGAIVNVDDSNPPRKMEMEIEGTPKIVIGSSADGPLRRCPQVLDIMCEISRNIVTDLATIDWR